MNNYDTPKKIIEALSHDVNSDEYRNFLQEWNNKPQEREEAHRKTLRYSVLKAYWENPEDYFDVMNLLDEHKIAILRNEAPIYALDDDDVVKAKIDEFSLLLNDIGIYDPLIQDGTTSYYHPQLTYKQFTSNLNKATKLFNKHPKLWGKYHEGELLYHNYKHDLLDNNIEIVKNNKTLPYSSTGVQSMLSDIAYSDDIQRIEQLRIVNPEYFSSIGKVEFRQHRDKLPKPRFDSSAEPGKYFLINNMLSTSLQKESYEMFKYLNENFVFNLSGASIEREEAKIPLGSGLKQDSLWAQSRYNTYKTQNEKYSRDEFTRNRNTSLLFEVFSDHMDRGEESINEQLSSYLQKTIQNGKFISLLSEPILTWSTSNNNVLGLNRSYDLDRQLYRGNASTSDLLFLFKSSREFIYQNSEEILKNEKDKYLKERFFNLLLKHSHTFSEKQELHETDYPLWEPIKDVKENIISVIECNSKYIAKRTEENYNDTEISKILHKELNKDEQKSILNVMVDFSQNDKISQIESLFEEDNIKILANNLTKEKDFSIGGKFNILEGLIQCNKVDSISYYGENEIHFINDDKRQKEYKSKVKTIINYFFDNGTYKLLMKNHLENRYGEFSNNGNLLAQALFLKRDGSYYFMDALSDKQVGLLLQEDLFNNQNTSQIKKAFYTYINDVISLEFKIKMDESLDTENIIRKLHNNKFDFSLPMDTEEQAKCFVKMLTSIKDNELLESIYKKYEKEVKLCFEKYSITNAKKENILNSIQNYKLFDLFAKTFEVEKIELLFRETDSEGTYKNFLEKTKIEIITKDRNILLESLRDKQYGIAKAIIEYSPESLLIASKTNRLPIEIAIKDQETFGNRKSNFYSTEDGTRAKEFIVKVIEIGVQPNNINKKSIANLSVAIDACGFNNDSKIRLSRYLLDLNNNIIPTKKNGKKIEATISGEDTFESNSFKI